MFKKLCSLAIAAVPALAGVSDDLAEIYCQSMTTKDGAIFTILGIEGATPYSSKVSGIEA